MAGETPRDSDESRKPINGDCEVSLGSPEPRGFGENVTQIAAPTNEVPDQNLHRTSGSESRREREWKRGRIGAWRREGIDRDRRWSELIGWARQGKAVEMPAGGKRRKPNGRFPSVSPVLGNRCAISTFPPPDERKETESGSVAATPLRSKKRKEIS